MKRSDIRNAYESMTPTQAQKDRMLAAILEKKSGQKRGKYQAQSVKTNKLAWIPAVAALFAVVTVGSFVLRQPQQETPVFSNEEIPTQDPQSNPTVYDEIIATCRAAIEEGWDADKCLAFNISPRFASSRDYARTNAGYQLLDIDGNGTQELLIGHENYIWNLYALDGNTTAVLLLSDPDDGTVYELHEGAHITKELTTKEEGWHDCYLLKGTELTQEASLYGVGNDYQDLLTGKTISAEEAFDIIYRYDRQELLLTWFFDYPESIRDGEGTLEPYLPIIEKYKTALTENWTWEQCDQADISREIMYDTTIRNHLGWCLLDIDQNGIEELIIGDGVHLFDLYTLMPNDGQPGHLLCASPDSYTLCKDGTIERREFYSGTSLWRWLRLSGMDLAEQNVMFYEGEQNQYSYGTSEQNLQPISKDEAGTYLANTEKSAMELPLTPFVEMEAVTYPEPNVYYEPIIETYRKAIEEGWDPGKCMENGISLMIGYYGELYTELGHNQIDLNGDGCDELIITDGANIFDLYTVIHDETDGALRLVDATERNQYYMTKGDVIYRKGSGGAALTYHSFYKVGERGLILQKAYMYDGSDPNNPWFSSIDEIEWGYCLGIDPQSTIDSYEIVEIPFVPFGDGGR